MSSMHEPMCGNQSLTGMPLLPYFLKPTCVGAYFLDVLPFSYVLLWRLGMVYGKKIEYYGPLYASHTIDGDKAVVKFTHTGQGLAFKHGEKLQGFAIAGEDKQFRWADAVIEGDTVIVSSPEVKKPAAIRYAWDNTHPWANLFNKDGLPALTFRTDSW